MAQIIKGNVMGVCVYGEVSKSDIQNFQEFSVALENLEKSLTKLFDKDVATTLMKKVLGTTKLELSNGEVENLEMLEMLYSLGVVKKSTHQREKVTVGHSRFLIG